MRALLLIAVCFLGCATAHPAAANLRADLPPESAARGACATLVTFVATWCFPCLGHLEILRSVHGELAPRGLTIAAIAMDLEGSRVVDPFSAQAQLPFAVRPASEPLREGATGFGRIQALPTTFIVGPDGEQLLAFEGVARPEDLKKTLAPLLARDAATDLKRFSCPR